MKAVFCTGYGDPEVLRLVDANRPQPKGREVLIKIHATAVTASDAIVRRSQLPLGLLIPMRLILGIAKPRQPILGLVLAGEIVEAGPKVTRFKVGERVFAFSQLAFGGYAQYKCLPETAVMAAIPSHTSFLEASALVYGGLLALPFLRKAGILPGSKVLIYGASGAIGTAAVQIAKAWGARVTAVCSASNFDLVRSLGADTLLDYTTQQRLDPGSVFDFVLDAVGKAKTSPLKTHCAKALTPTGSSASVDDGSPVTTTENLLIIRQLTEAGKLRSVIDRVFRLEQIVEAHRYVDQGHKKGNVVIQVDHDR